MDTFIRLVKKYTLLEEGDTVLVGVSGGPDSLTLLLMLHRLKKDLGIKLHVAHIDHNLRKESAGDALFVKNWAKKLGLPFSLKKLKRLSDKNGSLEEKCREERLNFLIRVAKRIKADKVALGHNLDDQAETVLMRILRGTGMAGLTGISPKKNIRGVTFIRPLLETPRQQIEEFLNRKKLAAKIDRTNLEDKFFRNKVRNRLIPLLKKEYNPAIVYGLAQLAESLSYDYEYLESVARNKTKGSPSRLSLKKIKKLPVSILRLKLRQAIQQVQGSLRRIGFAHIKEIEDMVENRPCGSIVNLPKGVYAKKTRDCLRFLKR